MYQHSNSLPIPGTPPTAPSEPAATPNAQWRVLNGVRRAPRRPIPKSWWITVLGMLAAVLVLYVHTVNQEFRLTRLKDDLRHMNEQLTELRSEKAKLQNPRNIDDLARKNLAMQPPADVVFMAPPKLTKANQANRIPMPPAVIHEGF
jgi:cell division protein FtsB